VHAHNYFPAFLIRNSVDVPMPGGDSVPGKQGKGDAYSQDLIAEETLKFIEANKEGRFFCYAAWTLPHGQFEIPDASAFKGRPWNQRVKNHAAMIARLDADVGRLMAKLEQLGLDDQTLVIFSSDNGADGPGREQFNGTAGLRGHKRHLYEGGIRAPMIAHWPGVIKAGSESDLLTSQVDFLTTACDLAGVEAPPDADGVSIAPTLAGKNQAAKQRALYWEIYEGPLPFQQAVRMDGWKGYRTALEGTLELYDLHADPQERSNIAAKHADVVKQIEGVMAQEHVRNPNWRPTKNPAEAGKKTRRRSAA
jgi:arylsulfatase A-like enzyme